MTTPRAHGRRWIAAGGILFLLATAYARTPAADQTSTELSYRVKAACLFNFLQFIEWPAQAFDRGDSPIVVGIIGDDPFGGSLVEMTGGESVLGRSITVKSVKSGSELLRCQMVFVPGSERLPAGIRPEDLASNHVLVVGETEGFANRGGAINFTMERGKVRFEINPNVCKSAGLVVSSKLLRLSKIVGEGTDEH